jgi:hypothetical protein
MQQEAPIADGIPVPPACLSIRARCWRQRARGCAPFHRAQCRWNGVSASRVDDLSRSRRDSNPILSGLCVNRLVELRALIDRLMASSPGKHVSRGGHSNETSETMPTGSVQDSAGVRAAVVATNDRSETAQGASGGGDVRCPGRSGRKRRHGRSGARHVTAHRIAQPPKVTFVMRLQPSPLPSRTARQLPDLSTTIRVRSSLTDGSRPRGALPLTEVRARG